MKALKIDHSSYKVGVNEIKGLAKAMREAIEPVRTAIQENVYWHKVELEDSEYTSRDGFIPYSHNCGGFEISEVIHESQRDDFKFLEFGECDTCEAGDFGQCGYGGQECSSAVDGHLDAKLRVWLKFEGIEDGEMKFYLYLGGGNGDAPYFRTKYEATIFESEFTAKSIEGFKRKATAQVKKLLKVIS